MSQTVAVHARMDRETKEASEAILRQIGMTPSEAVRLLYRQISLRQEFPLELKVPNSETTTVLEQSDRNEEVEYFSSVEEMKKSWRK